MVGIATRPICHSLVMKREGPNPSAGRCALVLRVIILENCRSAQPPTKTRIGLRIEVGVAAARIERLMSDAKIGKRFGSYRPVRILPVT